MKEGDDRRGHPLLSLSRTLRPSTPQTPPSALAIARLDQDAPLLNLGPKGRGPLGLSLRAGRIAALAQWLRVLWTYVSNLVQLSSR